MAKPSTILAQYLDGVLTREQATEAFRTAEWDTTVQPASFSDNYDGFLDPIPPESFTGTVTQAYSEKRITPEDYRAFDAAARQARVARTGAS